MLVSIILGTVIMAWLGHRVIARIVLPELAEQRREQFRDDRPHGDWPAVPAINQPRGD